MRHLSVALVACSVTSSDPRWSTATSIPEPLQEMHAAVLHGKIYIAGGFDRNGQPTAVAYRFDPAAKTWQRIADLPAARHHMPLAVAGDTLYAVGGLSETSFTAVNTLWIYREDDPATDHWSRRASMPSRRGGLASAVLGGQIHTFGGETRTSVFDNHETYDPAADRWSTGPAMPTARHGLAAAAIEGKIYLIGGGPRAGLAQTDVVEVFTP